jgi:hypothetical protein
LATGDRRHVRPMQEPVSFNLDPIEKKIDAAIKNHSGQE